MVSILQFEAITPIMPLIPTFIASEGSQIVSSSRTPTVSGQMTDPLAVCTFYSARAIVMKLALVAQWKSPSILLPFTSPSGVSLSHILPLRKLLLSLVVVIKFPLVLSLSFSKSADFLEITYKEYVRDSFAYKEYVISADFMDLYRLVKERYSNSRPEGYDLMLWGDLYTLFEPDEEDEIWKNQHEYNLISWRLCDFCGIHILLMHNGIAIHMFTEKKYPLSQEMLSKMLSKRLEVDHESTQEYELLKFIRSQVQK
ncbi:hypothetical protein Tco_0396642 [Tanacetum coccineum]